MTVTCPRCDGDCEKIRMAENVKRYVCPRCDLYDNHGMTKRAIERLERFLSEGEKA